MSLRSVLLWCIAAAVWASNKTAQAAAPVPTPTAVWPECIVQPDWQRRFLALPAPLLPRLVRVLLFQLLLQSLLRLQDGKPVWSADTLELILGEHFELVEEEDVPFLIREHRRKFQWGISHAMVWRRR